MSNIPVLHVGQAGFWYCYRTGKQTLVVVEVILEKVAKLSNSEFICLRDGENLHRSGRFLIVESDFNAEVSRPI